MWEVRATAQSPERSYINRLSWFSTASDYIQTIFRHTTRSIMIDHSIRVFCAVCFLECRFGLGGK